MQTALTNSDTLIATSAEAATPPAIGAYWPGHGGIYTGTIPGRLPGTSYHLITGPELNRDNWDSVTDQAATLTIDGHHDFTLPYCDEQELQRANIPDEFQDDYYWSCEQNAALPDYAWIQDFTNGFQNDYPKSNECPAFAVRRELVIQ